MIRKVLQKKFDDDLRTKGYNLTEALKEFIDKYNDKLSQDSPLFIEYYIKNNGDLIIENARKEWAQKRLLNKQPTSKYQQVNYTTRGGSEPPPQSNKQLKGGRYEYTRGNKVSYGKR